MTKPTTCTNCGAPLAEAGAMAGRCPRCLLSFGIDDPDLVVTRGHGAPRPPEPDELREHFPELEILELLGAGGMGAVYRARQRSLDRVVALKILRGDVADDPAFEERFHREARALARLNHPGIVAVFDSGSAGPYFYLLMEHVDGANLRSILRSGELGSDEVLRLVAQICDALQFAHREGVVHRDIKPENILVTTEGIVKIADFGLAKLVVGGIGDVSLTETSQTVGTLHYMAPEQIEKPGSVDHRADLYSLGVVFYELLTGELPLGRFMPPSEKVQVDVRLDEVVLKTLAKEPERRYQAADDIKTDVHRISTAAKTKGRCGPFRFGVVSGKGDDVVGVGNAAMEMIEELEQEEREEARSDRADHKRHGREKHRRPSAVGLGCGALGCLGVVALALTLFIPATLATRYEAGAGAEEGSRGGAVAPLGSGLRGGDEVGVAARRAQERASTQPSSRGGPVTWAVFPRERAAEWTRFPVDDRWTDWVGQRPVREWPRLEATFAAEVLGLSEDRRTEAEAILQSAFAEYLVLERGAVVALETSERAVHLRIDAFEERAALIERTETALSGLIGPSWEEVGGRELLREVMPFGDEAASVWVEDDGEEFFARLDRDSLNVLQSSGLDELAPPFSRLYEWYRSRE